MNAAALEQPDVRVGSAMASEQGWLNCADEIQAKVLSVDEARHTVESLFKIAAGYRSGKHRHTCETHLFVLKGKVVNHAIGCEFGPGDYCYQPFNDEHDEEFVEETVVYASYRGNADKLVEFFDDDGNVCGEFKVSDFSAMLA